MSESRLVDAMREKYSPKPSKRGQWYPAGSRDIAACCDQIDALIGVVRQLQRLVPAEEQNAVETGLMMLLGPQ